MQADVESVIVDAMAKSTQQPCEGLNRRAEVQIVPLLAVLLCLGSAANGLCSGSPDGWVPARWDGGPLEVARREKRKQVAEDASIREAIAQWYAPSTLGLIEGTPINCLLVTFNAGSGSEVEEEQQKLVRQYARLARERGIAVLGIVHPGADPASVAAAAVEAQLDGLVLEG